MAPEGTPGRSEVDRAHDLGLCTSGRAGLATDASYCGRFRAPSLRNVAARPSFFHNGAIRSLREAVAFYATRDTDPGRWYGRDAAGRVPPFDDLPAAYAPFVERGAPFEPLPGGRSRMSVQDIDDVVAFLETLTDEDVARRLDGHGAHDGHVGRNAARR
jgi:cytochrome c peroxidase